MKYRISCDVPAADANEALHIMYAMIYNADEAEHAENVTAELIDVPTKEEIKFLAEQSRGDTQGLVDVAIDLKYPHVDELVSYLMGGCNGEH